MLRKAQSIIEYIALVMIVAAAFGGMSFYVSRALEVRDMHLAMEMNETNR